jgi:hypothetical protein
VTEGHQRTNLGGSLCLALRGCRQLEAPSYRALRWGQRDPPARGKRTRKFSHPSQRASALSSPSVPASEVSVQCNGHESLLQRHRRHRDSSHVTASRRVSATSGVALERGDVGKA